MTTPRNDRCLTGPRAQRGAVLYVALIMLILLALIGIVGMQVASMQERMSANYRAVNIAFQNAEAFARNAECVLEDVVNRTSTTGCNALAASAINQVCEEGFDPGDWAEDYGLAAADHQRVNARLIGPCISGNAPVSALGTAPVNEDPNPIYQVTTYSTDSDSNASAAAAIDTIFKP